MSTPNTHYPKEELATLLAHAGAIYFLGIGGISMSSLARMTQRMGVRVGGYDRADTATVRQLRADGIRVDDRADAANLDGYDAVVYTVAISEEQPEYVQAIRRGLPLISRANYMGYLMDAYRCRIGVAGTHGKSTTTGMLTEILLAADTDPTVLCGATIPSLGGAYCVGGRDYMAFEACEYMDSFLDFYPTTAVVLNAELDHVDYFKSVAQMQASYTKFCNLVGQDGVVVLNADDDGTCAIRQGCVGRVVTFGIDGDADYRAADIRHEAGSVSFALIKRGEHLGRLTLPVPGRHNIYNALAAAAAAGEQGICLRAIADGLARFRGVGRRMERKGSLGGAVVYDDYAHHPTEIRASITAAREIARGRLICVFQSHTYSRTAALFDEFAAALAMADEVIVAPIYAAREENIYGVSEALLSQALCRRGIPSSHATSFEETAALLQRVVRCEDTVLVMGAGDIERIYPLLSL